LSRENRYLVDTNVLSEIRKRGRSERVMAFVQSLDPTTVYISVLTLGELRKGVELKRRQDPVAGYQLDAFVTRLELEYAERILPISIEIAQLWGTLSADRGRPIIDTLLAATAIAHDLTLVTRNTADFQGLSVGVVNPWEAAS
jgi:predicted nucleic acid-binding protein